MQIAFLDLSFECFVQGDEDLIVFENNNIHTICPPETPETNLLKEIANLNNELYNAFEDRSRKYKQDSCRRRFRYGYEIWWNSYNELGTPIKELSNLNCAHPGTNSWVTIIKPPVLPHYEGEFEKFDDIRSTAVILQQNRSRSAAEIIKHYGAAKSKIIFRILDTYCYTCGTYKGACIESRHHAADSEFDTIMNALLRLEERIAKLEQLI